MARVRDWIDLGKSTVSSLSGDDVTNFYAREWPETKKMLMAEHLESIEREPRRFRRWIRTCSAVMYGLAKRLAPHRRVLFILSFVAFFFCTFTIFTRIQPEHAHASERTATLFVELTASFLAMTLLLAMELIDKLKFRDELQLARDLQASLIPTEMPRVEPWELAAFNRIANTVGGDIYDFVPLGDGRMAVLFGDASGHGMAAGLVMAVAHAAFRTQLDVDPAPDAVIASLNRILVRTGGPRSFFACCYVLLSPDRSYTATVAGHPPILKIDCVGKVVERVGRGAYPLGIKLGLSWETVSGTLGSGERLLLHSDGLTESRNASDREFGDAYVETIASWHPQASATSFLDSLVGEWRMFMGGCAPEDDVSVAIVRCC